ncbi:MAG: DUF1285 domain-containing protein, partial [Marinobacter sp.]
GLPPVDQWHPELSGDIDIRIARDDNWYYKGELMERRALTKLFSTIMRREDDNEYYLVTPVEKWRIQVEDTPLQAHSLEAVGEGEHQELYLTTSAEERLLVGTAHLLVVGTYSDSDEPRPVVMVRHGLEARLVTSAFYELAAHVVENPDGSDNSFGVWSDGVFFEIGQGA